MSTPSPDQRPCCVPAGPAAAVDLTLGSPARADSGVRGTDPTALAPIPGGRAALGDHFGDGYAGDGERPVHEVEVSAFRLGTTAVTNAAFAAFVDATGHRTTAEVEGYSAVFHTDVAATVADVLGHSPTTPWWLGVRGADWRHPEGPRSDISDRPDHPVVHVSHDDALAFARWAGRRLPTEAEWEYAARGGLEGKRYPWGDDLMVRSGGADEWQVNIFQGTFPTTNTAEDGWTTTAPVTAYRPNGYGLHQMVGNVWEWCADWFDPKAYADRARQDPRGPADGTVRVMRGGSFLCHDSYCNRYRVAARSAAPPDSSASNLGFRCAADAATDRPVEKEIPA
ncbi:MULTISPECIES: formylglycine-generating enzyme family protein [unclassified Nocardioides]|uniref:formylglycine-generating enzyme family protein n=1 Tax=unclassified Nocardioides TaxID=2615069 RepID=UPI0011510079|nr:MULTISPECIES: formylglycine-generating enzyme family protein [unclassified Nocardioides]TQK70136.1 formylglycine-generating enzyme required for sulfatase activity [Nocardioides sp. SLBN-35]WGY00635.1 formylglycine-generating enzyme family protein [Nocardioides sp. QY071]